MIFKTPLCELAFKYGTDKCPQHKRHTYTIYYYNLLKSRKGLIKKVLEIGVDKGASLFMWRDFFPNAKIYGAEYRKDLLINQPRIESFLCDQRRRSHLKDLIARIGPDIDIVIDDASHRPSDQVFTCLSLMPLLNKKVIYVIEDVADPSIVNRLEKYDVEMPPLEHPRRNRYDNRLVVVKHKFIT